MSLATKEQKKKKGGEPTADLLKVLELEELVASVAGHVDEHVAALVGHQSLGPGHALVVPAWCVHGERVRQKRQLKSADGSASTNL